MEGSQAEILREALADATVNPKPRQNMQSGCSHKALALSLLSQSGHIALKVKLASLSSRGSLSMASSLHFGMERQTLVIACLSKPAAACGESPSAAEHGPRTVSRKTRAMLSSEGVKPRRVLGIETETLVMHGLCSNGGGDRGVLGTVTNYCRYPWEDALTRCSVRKGNQFGGLAGDPL
ncbi:hypothetical protein VTI74DRAFT_10774 [Chaetomium olivicolor]